MSNLSSHGADQTRAPTTGRPSSSTTLPESVPLGNGSSASEPAGTGSEPNEN